MREIGRIVTKFGDKLAGDPQADKKFLQATERDTLEDAEKLARTAIEKEALLPRRTTVVMAGTGDLYDDNEEPTISLAVQELIRAKEMLEHHRQRLAKAAERARIQAAKEEQRNIVAALESRSRALSVVAEENSGRLTVLLSGYEALLTGIASIEEAAARSELERLIAEQHAIFEDIRLKALALCDEQADGFELGPVNLIPAPFLIELLENEEGRAREEITAGFEQRYGFFNALNQKTLAAHEEQRNLGSDFDVTSLLPELSPEEQFDDADVAIPSPTAPRR